MKRTLLIAACCLLFAKAEAQTAGRLKWSATVENTVTSADDINLSAPTAVDNAGNVYVTGSFRQGFSFGSTWLSPIANSAYLGKYDAEGNPLWAVSLSGAATITCITVDGQDNVFIAGTLADAVVVGSTDGNSQTVSGKPGEVENQVSGFIAAYDADGVLKAVRVIWPEANAEVEASGLYWPMSGFPQIRFNHIEANGDKLYASAIYTGDVSMDNVQWEGMYMNIWDFMYDDLYSAGVFSVDASTLGNAESVAQVGVKEQLGGDEMQVESINFTTDDDGRVYVGFAAYGTLRLKTPGGGEEITLSYDNTTGFVEHAFVVASIQVQESSDMINVFYADPHDNVASHNVFGKMEVEGDLLYIGGTFHQMMPFDNSLVHVGGCDLFAAALDKNSLEVQWTAQSNLDEGNGDAQHFYENFSAMTVNNGNVSVYGYTIYSEGSEYGITGTYVYNFNESETTDSETPFVTGADLNGTTLSVLTVDNEALTTTVNVYGMEESGDGVNAVTTLDTRRVGDTFYFAEPTDVVVYDLQGRMLVRKTAATTLSIAHLDRGIYILSNGTSTLKVQKSKF